MQSLLRTDLWGQPDAACAGRRDPRGGRQARCVSARDSGRCCAAGCIRCVAGQGRGFAPGGAGCDAGETGSRPPGRAAEWREPRHDPVRFGVPGRARRASGIGRPPQGAHGAYDARQRVCRMGEPVRRRHDRTDRVFVRLLRDDRLRCLADARDRFSVSAILPAGSGRPHRASRYQSRADWPPSRGRSRGGGRRPGNDRGAVAVAAAGARWIPSRTGTRPLRQGA